MLAAAQAGPQLTLERNRVQFYIDTACIQYRNNEFGLDTVTHAGCKEATDSTAAICAQVFATGAGPCPGWMMLACLHTTACPEAGAWFAGGNTSNVVSASKTGSFPSSIDSGNVCSSQSKGRMARSIAGLQLG